MNVPIYIISKGRWESRLTHRALTHMGIPHSIVVEEDEYPNYSAAINHDFAKLLVLDPRYQEEYDVCDDFGYEMVGPGAVRNFVWDHSIAEGADWHWVMDDNIRAFFRLNKNHLWRANGPGIFHAMEAFVDRYENIAMAGPAYEMFVVRKEKRPPFVMNTRLQSCQLIRNDTGFRWRSRYNDDVDISLRMLKAGWCTVQFNAFAAQKARTTRVKGGLSELYIKEGTLVKSQALVDLHPDVARVVWRYGRWHHYVDYTGFKQRLKRRPDVPENLPPNEHGMELHARPEGGW